MATAAPDINVRGEPVERVYGNFVDRRFLVNRRYQRKLIWTIEEKQEFIDSLIRGYPVPIILLAESLTRETSDLEIIDGMQRLDAIVSFIENKYSVDGSFFDLDTMAVTKAMKDAGKLHQKNPMMNRDQCVKIASYLVPLSTYEFSDAEAVDRVFRRINSGGRQLSRQELRAAGAIGHFATAVRKLASKVRGDDSASDILYLNEMQRISITNRELDYGIDVENMFWVRQGILARDNVRKSYDEELIADVVAYMVSDEPVSSRTEFLDDVYGAREGAAAQARREDIERNVQRRTVELVVVDFLRVLDQLKLTFEASGKTLSQILFPQGQDNPIPRYFQAIFLAMYNLIVEQNLQVEDRARLIASLEDSGGHINVQGGGGRWSAESRQRAIQSVVGMIQGAFAPATNVDPATVLWITRLENLLSQSTTEQSSYDFKQGFLNLQGGGSFDDAAFDKILKTLVGMANLGRNKKGYVVVGVADGEGTALRVEQVFQVKPLSFNSFWITGVDHEMPVCGKTADQFFQWIIEKVRNSQVSEPLKGYIVSNLKPVKYFDKTVYVFESFGMPQPSMFNNIYYERTGAQLRRVEAASFGDFFTRYNA